MATYQAHPSAGLENPPERILSAADQLFTARSIGQVGVDELIAHSGVAKSTFYKYFPSKDELVLAYLQHWHQVRASAIDAAVQAYGGASEGTLADILAHVTEEWLQTPAADVSAFMCFTEPRGEDDVVGRACASYFSRLHAQIADLARAAGLHEPDDFARSWHIIARGAMVAALVGDSHTRGRAQHLTALLVTAHR